MNRQPELQNELVRIRPLREADREALYAVASDPELWALHVHHDRHERGVFDAFFDANLDSRGGLVIEDAATGAVIGGTRYQPFEHRNDAVEIGWTFLTRSHWGGRYNGAAKQLLLDHAFGYVDYVVFQVAGDNHRSHRAVRKIGGREIVAGSDLNDLRKDAPNYTTYVIGRTTWNSSGKRLS